VLGWTLILTIQLAVLSIGISREYQLKHEDINCSHAVRARSHQQLGLRVTKGQNYHVNRATGRGSFYAHHPPGPALLLAAVYEVTDQDGPLVTRGTAILFHLLTTALFLMMIRHLLASRWEQMLAGLVLALIPQSAFFGRMLGHEILVLPGAVLLISCYWWLVTGEGRRRWLLLGLVGASIWMAFVGWAGFFAIAACVLHALWELLGRKNRRALLLLIVLTLCGGSLLLLDLAHLAWVGGGLQPLRDLAFSRMGGGADYSVVRWLAKMIDIHRTYFTCTGFIALVVLVLVAVRAELERRREPAAELGMIFLLSGLGYLVVFNSNAYLHHFWHFLLIPASAIAVVVTARRLLEKVRVGRRPAIWMLLLVLAIAEMITTTTLTLIKRHTRVDQYCIETVQRKLERYSLDQ
jgi:4-amino-4-deoxy-L-arabinose transferase-like glycosyltransferase